MISIIIPVYNAEKYITECAKSIMEQTYDDWEAIFIDDGSVDDSLNILRLLAKHDSRIKCMHQENAGVSAARNNGLKCVKGNIIVFVDADDVIDRQYLQKLAQMMENSDAELAMVSHISFENDDELQQVRKSLRVNDLLSYEINNGKLVDEFFNKSLEFSKYSIATVWGKAYRKEFLSKIGNEFIEGLSMGEDLLFNLTCALHIKKFCYDDEKLYFYRVQPNSAMRKFNANELKTDFLFLEKMKTILEETSLFSKYEEGFYRYAYNGLRGCLKKFVFNKKYKASYRQRKDIALTLINKEIYKKAVYGKYGQLFWGGHKVEAYRIHNKKTNVVLPICSIL